MYLGIILPILFDAYGRDHFERFVEEQIINP